MLVAGRARCRFNIGERLIAHVAAGGRGDEISGDRCEQGERFLSSEIAVGMTVTTSLMRSCHIDVPVDAS